MHLSLRGPWPPVTADRDEEEVEFLWATGKKILIAVDGSSYSLQAIKYVAAMCSGSKVEVDILHVLPTASEELLWQIDVQ